MIALGWAVWHAKHNNTHMRDYLSNLGVSARALHQSRTTLYGCVDTNMYLHTRWTNVHLNCVCKPKPFDKGRSLARLALSRVQRPMSIENTIACIVCSCFCCCCSYRVFPPLPRTCFSIGVVVVAMCLALLHRFCTESNTHTISLRRFDGLAFSNTRIRS